jgi:hypothetical protein
MKQVPSDPVIDEIREVRHRISARFDHDPARLVAHYMELQKQYQDQMIETGESSERSAPSAAEEVCNGKEVRND